jgi:hypothetical protein
MGAAVRSIVSDCLGWKHDVANPRSQDTYLKYMADHFELTVFSVGYRLAPEDPWPACAEDCYDAAEWLVKNGQEVFGGELMFTGGEVRLLSTLHGLLLTNISRRAAISPVS